MNTMSAPHADAGNPIEESKGCCYGCNLFYRKRSWICKPPPHGKLTADVAEAGDAADVTAATADAIIGENKAPHCPCYSYFRRRCARLSCGEGEEALARLRAEGEPQN